MKVKELIAELSKCNQDVEVRIYETDHPFGETFEVKMVTIDKVYDESTIGSNAVLVVI